MTRLGDLATAAAAQCAYEGWSRDWEHGGVYLHLEVSEFIEALRGKGGDPVDEMADVLFVLLSTAEANGISSDEALELLTRRLWPGAR